MDAVFVTPDPRNEPVRDYAPGSPERAGLTRRLGELASERVDLTMTIDGRRRMGGGEAMNIVQPHRHAHVLGVTHKATSADAAAAVAAADVA
jgi:1-pyrroline-5-carboxylate dehydrogenase